MAKTPRYTLLFYCFILFGAQNISYSQEITSKDLDSLIGLSFKELYNKFYETIETNRPTAEAYAKAYLQKGKNLDSIYETSNGFFYMSKLFISNYKQRIKYLDSAFNIVENTSHVQQIAFLYTHKGVTAQTKGDYDEALDSYLKGLAHSKKERLLPFVSALQSNIATLKRKLRKYEEAKSLFNKCLEYRKGWMGKRQNDSIPYLITLSDLVTTCRQNKELDSALYYHNQGYQMSKSSDIEGLFNLNKGIFNYYNKEYLSAIETINIGLEGFLRSKLIVDYGYHNIVDAYFFLGKSYNALSKKEMAISYFKKIDSMALDSESLVSESRPAYLEIIDYYKSQGDKNNQLYYINRLLHNDSIFNVKNKSSSDKLLKQYDTPLLISQKEELIAALKTKNNQSTYGLILSSIIIFIISSIFLISYQKNKTYKKRFDELMHSIKKETKTKRHKQKTLEEASPIGIAENVVEKILNELNAFENNNGFLEINLTSSVLASKLNTNSKYLTKVIKFYRKKNFTQYINDLRVDHIIKQLKTDFRLQNYTIKALATEAGFNSTEVFSKYFFKKTGIYPSYFVKRLLTHENS